MQPSGASVLMAYVPGFDYDIFISYPRENNRADPHGLRWVSEFHRYLTDALNLRIPSNEKPKIYFDDHYFELGEQISELLDKARRSAIFLAIVSPSYVAPEKFTAKELRAYCDNHTGNDRKIVSLHILPLCDEAPPPSELRGFKRIDFFWKNESDVEVPLTPRHNDY